MRQTFIIFLTTNEVVTREANSREQAVSSTLLEEGLGEDSVRVVVEAGFALDRPLFRELLINILIHDGVLEFDEGGDTYNIDEAMDMAIQKIGIDYYEIGKEVYKRLNK